MFSQKLDPLVLTVLEDRQYHPHVTGKKTEPLKGDLMEIPQLRSGDVTCGLDSLARGAELGSVCVQRGALTVPVHPFRDGTGAHAHLQSLLRSH